MRGPRLTAQLPTVKPQAVRHGRVPLQATRELAHHPVHQDAASGFHSQLSPTTKQDFLLFGHVWPVLFQAVPGLRFEQTAVLLDLYSNKK